jgi:hypothetical protein
VLGRSLADALKTDGAAVAKAKADGKYFTATDVSATSEQSVISQISDVAVEAAKNAAFPLLLVALVFGFLMVQNRIDSRDPKLALAPVDSDYDLLSFT